MLTSRKQTTDIKSKVIKELESSPDIKVPFWSDFETNMMRKYYIKKGPRAMAKALKRSITSIYDKASAMGLSVKDNKR